MFNKQKSNQRQILESSPAFSNLVKIEKKGLNYFAKSLLTLYPESYKDWKEGQHLILRGSLDGSYFNSPAYCTSYSNNYSFDSIIKEKLNCNHTSSILYLDEFDNHHLVISTYDTKIKKWKRNEIFQLEDGFFCNGQWFNFNAFNKVNGKDPVTTFTMKSLVKQMCLIKGPTARSLGGKAKAANQTGYQTVRMIFQHKNGEMPKEEIKTVVDAYKICSKYLKGQRGPMTIKGLRDILKKQGYKKDLYDAFSVDCGSYVIYLSFGTRSSTIMRRKKNNNNKLINSNTIVLITEEERVPKNNTIKSRKVYKKRYTTKKFYKDYAKTMKMLMYNQAIAELLDLDEDQPYILLNNKLINIQEVNKC